MSFQHHNWSGWPGAWCLDCGIGDPGEQAIADGYDPEDIQNWPDEYKLKECPEPGSNRFNPYKK